MKTVVNAARLNVNIDHVATVRQARRAPEPSVVAAAMICEQAGADGITVHLRGDRRHIQDHDLKTLRSSVTTYLNMEMAATEEMLKVALDTRPDAVSLVAENPDEITTEGGLDVAQTSQSFGRRSADCGRRDSRKPVYRSRRPADRGRTRGGSAAGGVVHSGLC